MFKLVLIAAGGIVIYAIMKGRQAAGIVDERVRGLQRVINLIQVSIYQAAVAQSGGVGQPPLFFHELGEDGIMGADTHGAIANLRYFVRNLDPVLIDAANLRVFYSLDQDRQTPDQILTAIAPLYDWSQRPTADQVAVALTRNLGDVYLSLTRSSS